MTLEQQGASATGRTVSDEYRRMVKSLVPQVTALLNMPEASKTPNFLDVLTALSDMVAFYTECDSIPTAEREENIFMSVKFCRFCC